MTDSPYKPDELDSQPTFGALPLKDRSAKPAPPLSPQAVPPEAGRPDTLDQLRTSGVSTSVSSDLGGLVEQWPEAESGQPLEERYELQTRLGVGGMGEVWQAIDRRLNRPVAIKRLVGDLVRRRGAIERFLKEAQAVARLNHPNIVHVYDFGHDRKGPYLVMELVDGKSLAEHGRLEIPAALDLTCKVCDGLAAAHRQGIIHRDIKPANILLASDGTPKLSDFGVAHLEGTDYGQTQAGAILGTPDFMAPEHRADSTRADARSDLWSLAATLYQIVTGLSPRIILGDRIPEQIRPVLLKALELAPEKRYQTAGELTLALLQTAQQIKEQRLAAEAAELRQAAQSRGEPLLRRGRALPGADSGVVADRRLPEGVCRRDGAACGSHLAA